MADDLNFQVSAAGFDSYLSGIIPDDQAVAAGAFSIAMQQIRNITKVPPAAFAKVVFSLESTKGLDKINGTDVPTDTTLAADAKTKQGLGSGVYGTYTMSNYYGAMSGLPYPWKNIYNYIKSIETPALKAIYKNLYNAVTSTSASWPTNNTVVQSYIDQANAEIANIKNNPANADTVNLLNTSWEITGTALKHEQRARYIAISPVPVPYDRRYSSRPTSINSFVDSVPNYAASTEPHMTVQTLEQICDMKTVGGQSIIGMLRSARNQSRLAEVGIELDNNIPSQIDPELEKRLMVNGTIPGAVEGVKSSNGSIYTIPANPTATDPYTYYDTNEGVIKNITNLKPGSLEPILNGNTNPIVNPEVPSGPGTDIPAPVNPFVINQNVDTFPGTNINSDYTGTTLQPSIYNVNEAIDKVIECNCDCWVK